MLKRHTNLLIIFLLLVAVAFSRPFFPADVYADDSAAVMEEDGAIEIDCPPQLYIPDAEDGTDNDELFEYYIENELNEGLPPSGKIMLKSARLRLSGTNLAVYNVLKTEIAIVADGKRASTKFEITLADLSLKQTEWTNSELGIADSADNKERLRAVFRKIGFDPDLLLNAIIADCPYDLYWYDKTAGVSTNGPGFYVSGNTVHLATGMTFSFSVADGYSAGAYKVDTSHGARVQHAVSKAKSIVENHKSGSDFLRLIAYKEEICGLVNYDTYAAHNNIPYGDSWQLISVFDEDPSTNVVCEGYAKAFQYLCDLTSFSGNVSCISVTGTMKGGTGAGGHMWNIVTMEDGFSYLVDVTNCDYGAVGADDKLFLVGYSGIYGSNGYYFYNNKLTYVYDDDALSVFSDELQIADHDYISEWDTPCIDSLGHTFSAWERHSESTCTRHGYETHICSKCGLKKPRALPLAAHDWGSGWVTVKKPTYTADGLKERTCRVCKTTEQEEIAKLARTSISKATVSSIKAKVYTGKALKPAPTVKVGGKTLRSGTDYKLTYSKNKKVGIATVKITGIGAYKGSLSKTFKIRPKATSLKKLTPQKKGFTAKWTRKTAQTTGYQLQYSTRKTFASGKKTVTVTRNSKVSRTVTKLKARKKYYVRVRTYKTVNGKRFYSKWSKVKTVTTRK